MYKKLASGSIGLLLLASPLLVSGQTTVSVQAQIDALLKQITQLQAQITALRGQSTTPTASTSRCLDLKNALIDGSTDATTNGEVSKLQRFLGAYRLSVMDPGEHSGIPPEELQPVTGYYGTKTAASVMQWQKAHGMDFVTTRSGVGPMTRAKMKCTNQTPVISSFVGPATLAVNEVGTWTAQVSDSDNDRMRYVVRWGDEPSPGDVAHPLNWPGLGFATEYFGTTFTHAYRQAGTYTIRLSVVDSADVNHVAEKTTSVKIAETSQPAIQKINWRIEPANPSAADSYKKDEQAIFVDVIRSDNSIRGYSVGKAYGCAASSNLPSMPGKRVLGFVNCYYALSGVAFTAYEANGRFVVERHSDDASGRTSGETTVVLEI